MLVSCGLSHDLRHLDDTWVRQRSLHRVCYLSRQHGMMILFHEGHWCITEAGIVLARAARGACHPNTVLPGEWEVQHSFPSGWRVDADFHLSYITTDDVAADIFDLGSDFFVRVPPTGSIRFTHPSHSGEPLG